MNNSYITIIFIIIFLAKNAEICFRYLYTMFFAYKKGANTIGVAPLLVCKVYSNLSSYLNLECF